jgi:phosphate transport system permease protein
MTDATAATGASAQARRPFASLLTLDEHTKRRNATEARFKAYGLAAVLAGLFFLVVLFVSIISNGIPAFTRMVVELDFTLTQEQFDEAESQLLKTGAYQAYFVEAFDKALEERGVKVEYDAAVLDRLIGKVGGIMREFYLANPDKLGEEVVFELPTSSRVDGYFNGRLKREDVSDSRFLEASSIWISLTNCTKRASSRATSTGRSSPAPIPAWTTRAAQASAPRSWARSI